MEAFLDDFLVKKMEKKLFLKEYIWSIFFDELLYNHWTIFWWDSQKKTLDEFLVEPMKAFLQVFMKEFLW